MRYMFAKRGDSHLFCHIGHNAQLLMLYAYSTSHKSGHPFTAGV